MVETLMEDEHVERLRSRQIGDGWIEAIMEKAPERLEKLCLPEVASQLLTPKRYLIFDNVTDLAAKLGQWFGDWSEIHIEHSRVQQVGERLGITYRFLLLEQGEWLRVEHQVYCTLQGDRIARLQLLCSGFQPVGSTELAAPVDGLGEASPVQDALLVFHTKAAESGSTCAVLTPAIKAKLREMSSGQVLEVRVDDLDAKEDIEAWCRLSGNALLRMNESAGPELQFFVKKK